MDCASCGTVNRAGRKFCGACGGPLSAACPACGAANEPGERYCGECGSGLEPPAAAPVVAASTPEVRAAEVRQVSVLFCDLVGYTSLSETRDAEDVREVLSGYFDVARTVVTRYGGTIEKYIGDAVMAVWGVPAAREDDAGRAVRAALDLVAAVEVYGEGLGTPLQARAGVVTGRAASVTNPLEGIVVGDRVNTAARVQAVAQPGALLVDGTTREVTRDLVAYADAGLHAVKGKAEPLQLWRAERVITARGDRVAGPLEVPVVGRTRELAVVRELFHASIEEERTRLLAVTGPAGVGKSRLFGEFDTYVEGLAVRVTWHTGRCLAYGDGVAYWALAEMVRQRFDIAQDEGPDAVRAKLAAGLQRWVPDAVARDYVEPRLGVLLGLDDVGMPREELFAGWRLFVEQLAAAGPVVLAFEDMQWADPGLVQFLEQLLDWSPRIPVFVLVMARPDLAERYPGLSSRPNATTLALDPLSDTAVGTLLDHLVPGLPGTARTLLVERTAGIPLYAVEIVRNLVDRGVLVGRDGAWSIAGEFTDVQLPATLTGLLSARIDALPRAQRALVRELSVYGGAFPRAAALAVSDLAEDEVDAALAALVRRDVLTVRRDPLSPDRGQHAFGQTLLRAAANATLTKQERRRLHLRAAEHLRATFPGDGEEVVEVIAEHYRDAWRAVPGGPDAEDLRSEAARSYGRAGRRAASVGAPVTAERAYRAAAELTDDEDTATAWLVAAGHMALSAGRESEALELFEELHARHLAAGRTAEAAAVAAPLCATLGRLRRYAEAETRATAALATLDPGDPAGAALVNQLARAAFYTAGDALGLSDRALALAAASGDTTLLAQAAECRGLALLRAGRLAEGVIMLRWATEDLAAGLPPSDRVRALVNLAALQGEIGLPGAEATNRRAVDEGRRLGDVYLHLAKANLAALLLESGRWDEARRLAEEVLDEPSLPAWARVGPGCQLVLLHALRGDPGAARQARARYPDDADSENPRIRASHLIDNGVVAAAAGDDEEALRLCGAGARAAVQTTGTGESFPVGWSQAVEAALRLGRTEDARELVGLVAGRPRGLVAPGLRAELARFQGRLAALDGDDEAATTSLRTAVGELEELGYPYRLALAQADLADHLARTGDPDEAARLRAAAEATFTRLGAVRPGARVVPSSV